MQRRPKRKRSLLEKVFLFTIGFVFLLYFCAALLTLTLRYVDPPTTMVQVQREADAALAGHPYNKHYLPVPLSRIAPDLQYAVIAAEDGRFYIHHGFDFTEMQKVVKDDLKNHRLGRGASTITQQLAKNVFLGTERSMIRKGIEATLVPIFELLLPKNRILELYLNVVEWGPGVFGAEAASEHWYHKPASELNRDEAARMAALLPNPLKRYPAIETEYADEIQDRMKKMGW